MALPDLDRLLETLRVAVDAKAGDDIVAALEAIDVALAEQNPAIRATTYAQVQLELGKPLAAAEVIEDLISVLGDDAKLCYQLGCYRKLGGQRDRAREALARAVELDPEMVEAWISLGVVLDEQGEPKAAIDCYRPVLLRAPEDADVWRNLGNSLSALGRFDEAAGAYDTALGLRPGDPTIAFLRASSHRARGDIDRANELLPRAFERDLGRAIEVRSEDARVDLRCRFHIPPEHESAAVGAAVQLMAEVADDLDEGGERQEDVFVVSSQGVFLVCDRDAVRPKHPNRFFDASVAIAKRLPR